MIEKIFMTNQGRFVLIRDSAYKLFRKKYI